MKQKNPVEQRKTSSLLLLYTTSLLLLLLSQTCIANDIEHDDQSSSVSSSSLELKHRDIVADVGEKEYRRKITEAFGLKNPKDDALPNNNLEYGVDISFPIHRVPVSTNYPWLPHNVDPIMNPTPPGSDYEDMPLQPLGDKKTFYEKMIEGCANYYGNIGERCYMNERDRVDMNLRQPKSMQNYTDVGFKKIRAPKKVYSMIQEFWQQNMNHQSPEDWPAGNTYTNHWESPTYMLNVEDESLPGGGFELKNKIWDAARDTIQEWTGEQLTPCSLYGIRVYKEGAVLATHVDRLPLVSSAIINVAQDVDEPWPIEVYAHDGKAYNITMEPGDMVLYESHSILHGRPFPLVGRYYANVFIHFEPTGHSLRHEARMHGDDAEEFYKRAMRDERQDDEEDYEEEEDEDDMDLPPYIVRGSSEEERWRKEHGKKRGRGDHAAIETGSTNAHSAASRGDAQTISKIAMSENKKRDLHTMDVNGWQPLHEAARGGHVQVVEVLVDHGVDINARTNGGKGGTALWLSETTHGSNHPLTKFLARIGALSVGPEL